VLRADTLLLLHGLYHEPVLIHRVTPHFVREALFGK
jgi:hypothetical protein